MVAGLCWDAERDERISMVHRVIWACVAFAALGVVACSGSGGVAESAAGAQIGARAPDCAGQPENLIACGSQIGGEEDVLYRCGGGGVLAAHRCRWGCQVNAAGIPDACREEERGFLNCVGQTDGFTACGETLELDRDTLFQCQRGLPQAIQSCLNGCQVNPPGYPDACR
jgi:hypothetical protein